MANYLGVAKAGCISTLIHYGKTNNSAVFDDRFQRQFKSDFLTFLIAVGSRRREDVGCRRISEVVEGFLVPLEALESPLKPRRGRHQSVRVSFRGNRSKPLSGADDGCLKLMSFEVTL